MGDGGEHVGWQKSMGRKDTQKDARKGERLRIRILRGGGIEVLWFRIW